MKKRLVIPEILDSLSHEDPAAQRSRRDLRLVNVLMGNYRWILERMRSSGVQEWIEVGAGSGKLGEPGFCLKGRFQVAGVDFAPRPAHWPAGWDWEQGDLFEALNDGMERPERSLVAVLFLHHFETRELLRLGEILNHHFSHLLIAEPARYRFFRIMAYLLFPFVNAVTRHDMQVSIGAGFRVGELSEALRLDPSWQVWERVDWMGGYRFEARRKEV